MELQPDATFQQDYAAIHDFFMVKGLLFICEIDISLGA